MKPRYDCVLYLILPVAFCTVVTAEHGKETRDPKDETELLDKEYGVRYANECEGK